jgi:hypothetical protein
MFYPCGKGPSFILSTIQYPMKEQADDGTTTIDGIRTDRKLCGTGKPFVKAESQGRQLDNHRDNKSQYSKISHVLTFR